MRYLLLVLALMSTGCNRCTQWHSELKVSYERYYETGTDKVHETTYRTFDVCDKGNQGG